MITFTRHAILWLPVKCIDFLQVYGRIKYDRSKGIYYINYTMAQLHSNGRLPPKVKLPRRYAINICGICKVCVSKQTRVVFGGVNDDPSTPNVARIGINVPMSSTLSPDVSGTTNHEMQKSKTLVPAKTNPVLAPRLPLSMLYML